MSDTQPIGMDLKLQSTLPVLDFNMDELKDAAMALAGKYKGLVFTEAQIPEVRKDMAYLNQVVERLEDARKSTVKQMEGPIRAFEKQVKELAAVILEARTGLAKQVQEFVDSAREEKRAGVLRIIDQARKFFPGISAEFAVDVRDSWLAASTPKSKINAEVTELFSGEEKRLADLKALTTAKEERTLAVEQKLQTMNQVLGLSLSMAAFLSCLDLQKPLGDVYEHMEEVAGEAANAKRLEETQSGYALELVNNRTPELCAIAYGLVPAPAPDAVVEAQAVPTPFLVAFSAKCAPEKLDDVKMLLRKVFALCTEVTVKIG